MRQIQTQLSDDLKTLLVQTPCLADKYENKDINFVESFKEWLIKGEKLLKSYNEPKTSELAGLRSTIIAAERGLYDRNTFVVPSTNSRKKISSSIAAVSLFKAQEILQEILNPLAENIKNAKNLLKQILALAAQKNLIKTHWMSKGDLSKKLQNLWLSFKEDSDLKSSTNHVLTLVSYIDALRLIEEILDEWTDTSS